MNKPHLNNQNKKNTHMKTLILVMVCGQHANSTSVLNFSIEKT